MSTVRSKTLPKRAPQSRFVERQRACERPLALDEVVDRRLPIGPVGLRAWLLEDRRELIGHRREVGIVGAARPAGTGRHQRQGSDACRVVQREPLGESAAHGDPDDMSAGNSEGVEYAHSVRDEIELVVPRSAGLIGNGLPGVAEVETDHEAPAGRKALAEFVLPPVHRAGRPGDQQNRRSCRVAERLDVEIDAVRDDRSARSRRGVRHALAPATDSAPTSSALGSIQMTSHR